MSWRVSPSSGEVGEDLADDRAELEAVAGEAGAEDGELGLRMAVDQEVLVRARARRGTP